VYNNAIGTHAHILCVRVSLLHYCQRQGGYVFIFTGALVIVCLLAELRKN